MIKSIQISEIKLVYKDIPLKEYIHNHACFILHDPIQSDWADMYNLPTGKRIIYIYHESYDSYTGDCTEHEGGFIVLHLEEYVNDAYEDLKEFCLNNLERIIHSDPALR